MMSPTLTDQQRELAHAPTGKIFISGLAGSGKTTIGVNRLRFWLQSGIPASQILVLVPQRTLAAPYYNLLKQSDLPPGGQVSILTIGGIAQRMTDLFFPLVARQAGFAHPELPPAFLTLETAQYYLARIVKPLLAEGYFDSLTIDRNRLLSQIIDNLNKAAVVPFPYTEIASRLASAWVGEPAQQRIYQDAQDCAIRFRQFCLQHNLLDFSLQMETFTNHLWGAFLVREYLAGAYRYLLYDNVEEDVPIAHDIIRDWLPHFEGTLLIFDEGAGVRSFLGADEESGYSLKEACDHSIQIGDSWVTSPAMSQFSLALSNRLHRRDAQLPPGISTAFQLENHRFYPQMIDWVTAEIQQLIQKDNISPGEIVILAPYLSDALRFSLLNRLEQVGVPAYSHRPSRSLREEPVTNCLLTLSKLAHPHWKLPCTAQEVRQALFQTIDGLDLVRADLLTRITFHPNHQEPLSSFDAIRPDMQGRITFTCGARFEQLRAWLAEYQQTGSDELDIFLSRLFGEVLSQPGFQFHANFPAASVTARLIESIRKFRWAIQDIETPIDASIGQEYMQMVAEGVVAAQYLQQWENLDQDAVLVAPAHTFLMSNRLATVQFWLDIGSQGWWERLYQPLTHPFVLSRHWQTGTVWTDVHERNANLLTLERLLNGLLRRCRAKVYLCSAKVNEQGNEQRGPLLQALQGLLRQLKLEASSD